MPEPGLYRITKLLLDFVFCGFVLLLLLPLFVLIALAIRYDSEGPIFFLQLRGGKGGKPFSIRKFRTMVKEAGNDLNVPQARQNDARVTRVGAFLRRHSLDELPQLLNVLKGDMSLVGPRPHALSHDTAFAQRCPEYTQRFRVKPGLTGWAQVNGFRGLITREEDLEARTRFDNYYIDQWSIWLEARILVLSLLALLRDKNAY